MLDSVLLKWVKNVQSGEWNEALEEFEDTGYCCFTPDKADFPCQRQDVRPLSRKDELWLNYPV